MPAVWKPLNAIRVKRGEVGVILRRLCRLYTCVRHSDIISHEKFTTL